MKTIIVIIKVITPLNVKRSNNNNNTMYLKIYRNVN